jgi:polyisoprenyl-teichoic acid--peptidoglycan teichoic acid transferase
MNNDPYDPDQTEYMYLPEEPEQPAYPSHPQYPDLPEPGYRGGEGGPLQPLPPTTPHTTYDPLAETRYHPVSIPKKKRRRRAWGCCAVFLLLPLLLLIPLAGYFLVPGRTNILLLGLDSRPGEGMVSRTDTIILSSIEPLEGRISLLSIPRDLWVTIPGVGENRINTAHFFAEANQAGTGPEAAMETTRTNFGVTIDYYVRLRFDGFQQVVDAMNGVDVELPRDMSGYTAGTHRMNGEQALALVRDRSGSDDFYRMERSQLFLKALIKQLMKPASWPHLPEAALVVFQSTDTDVPVWLWPRLGMALLRAGPDGIDSRAITREFVIPFTTSGGAQVLAPNWAQINPVLMEMFGQ